MTHADFKTTSAMQQLEGLSGPPMVYRRGFVLLLQTLAFLSMPVVLAGLLFVMYVIDVNAPVVTGFTVERQAPIAGGVEISGVMTKARDCELLEVTAITGQRTVSRLDFMDLNGRPAFSRPVGLQSWGPWWVWAEPGQAVTLYARHRCHILWASTREIGSFMVQP